ncbi:SDR family NAD(P)-dependent oxidoreductase [Compostimonas suwonensis]|uniref:Glucose 1-dehydrogenase/3-oxoacyl-[acyl-carrier protein] reductase n=1 Tax=Compostimonas suwonensis TaxID=1048394 RepID=A0A2M9BZU6_9MICO|nr:SDR family NAD(P)-dependent oxidoreductase [Compostimonas suwonensis]PJJ63603.1 glucose 1-dehydrogenase/3-oxoacyl-[acyl-carrier protein] reductase [Compostimonas suwonensis]
MRLQGRAALVTGAGGGLGSAIATGLAQEGASVALHDRRRDDVEELYDAIRREGGDAEIVTGDIAAPGGARSIVGQAVKALGGLDLLVNNAGIMSTTAFLDLSEDEWRNVIDVNLTGYFLVGQAAARHMVAHHGGAIVNVSSTRQVQSWPGSLAYASSKGGIAALTRSMALELAPHGVRVNSIAPGTFVTDLNREYVTAPEFRRKRTASIPAGRYGETSEVVGAVVFLASDEASFVVGASLMIDGGQTLW